MRVSRGALVVWGGLSSVFLQGCEKQERKKKDRIDHLIDELRTKWKVDEGKLRQYENVLREQAKNPPAWRPPKPAEQRPANPSEKFHHATGSTLMPPEREATNGSKGTNEGERGRTGDWDAHTTITRHKSEKTSEYTNDP